MLLLEVLHQTLNYIDNTNHLIPTLDIPKLFLQIETM